MHQGCISGISPKSGIQNGIFFRILVCHDFKGVVALIIIAPVVGHVAFRAVVRIAGWFRGEVATEGKAGEDGHLARVAGLQVPEKLLSLPELVCFQGSPRTLAIERDPCVKTATGLPDVKSGSRGSFPAGCFLFHSVAVRFVL